MRPANGIGVTGTPIKLRWFDPLRRVPETQRHHAARAAHNLAQHKGYPQ